MDGRRLFPRGWHPQDFECLPSGGDPLPDPPPRTSVGGVRYYFIDFGISTRGTDSITGRHCQEPAPELSDTKPYNPFKLDVFVLGKAYQHYLIEVNSKSGVRLPVLSSTINFTPDARSPGFPSATRRLHDTEKPGRPAISC
jgi:hypothetical protein